MLQEFHGFFAAGISSCSPQTGFNTPSCSNGTSYNANAGSVYVAKFSILDNSLKWSTFYNNSAQSWTDITANDVLIGAQNLNPSYDKFMDIDCDDEGNSYIAGAVYSGGQPISWFEVFPSIPPGAYYQPTVQGGYTMVTDCFILSFNSSNQRVWATHYGGNDDIGNSLDYPDNFDLPTSILAYKAKKLFLVGYNGKENDGADEFNYPCYDPGPQTTGSAYYFDNDPDYEHGVFNWDVFIGRFDLTSIGINIDDISYSQNRLNVYPNPSIGIINIKFPEGNISSASIAIRTTLGKILKEETIDISKSNIQQIDFGNFPAGMYLLDITVGLDHYSQKVIKQ
ncbi:MAG: T9SS type A sorting domain-containing protein [Chitinophagaceae bacterium]|nr:T9SS type A sorting domain-containing protein [Chitinophagaceae bacterium]